MKRLHQLSKNIQDSRGASAQNTRRIAANFPLVERKLDILSGDYNFLMDFPLTRRDHSAILTLKVKPDNCCQCDPGAQTVVRDAIGYWDSPTFGPNDNEAYPVVLIEPLSQTGTNFNYGYSSPFFVPIYQDFPYIAGYTINPTGGMIVPVDGVYSVLFKIVLGGAVMGGDSAIILSLRTQTPQPDSTILEEIVSRKIYSMAKGNLDDFNLLRGGVTYYQYATCIPIFGGATIVPFVQAININTFNAQYGWGNINNSLRINLLGLGYGTLIGKVFDNADGSPILGATVTYSEGFGGTTITDEFGYYAFYDLRPATYSVTVTATNYYSLTRSATVHFNKITELDFNLTHV